MADYLLINRNGKDYKFDATTFSGGKYNSDDYIVVSREGKDYKTKISDLEDFVDAPMPPPPEAVPPNPGIVVGNWKSSINADINPPGRNAIAHSICVDSSLNPHGQWNSITYTYNVASNTTKMYWNGKLMGEEIQQYVPDNDYKGSDLALFTLDPNNGPWRGAFHQWFRNFRMYNRTLTADEVKMTYQKDQDFFNPWRPTGLSGILVDIDARVSRRNIDTSNNYCYVENLVDGSMDSFWWTDGGKRSYGGYPNGATHPNSYMEFDDTYGIYKVNEGRGSSNGAWVGSKFHPDINVDWSFQYTLSPLAIGKGGSNTWLMAVAVVNWTNISLGFGFGNCSPTTFP